MMNKPYLRVIGDIHGYTEEYLRLINGVEYSIQLGDMGFPGCLINEKLKGVDHNKHRVLLGNHDDYENRIEGDLGDYGIYKQGNFKCFYIRGAYSIDKQYRTTNISWWEQEELNFLQGYECVELYQKENPKIVLSHDCPNSVINSIAQNSKGDLLKNFKPSITHQILQACFESFRPKLWIFAHHHINLTFTACGTKFICLDGYIPEWGNKAGFIDFNEQGELLC